MESPICGAVTHTGVRWFQRWVFGIAHALLMSAPFTHWFAKSAFTLTVFGLGLGSTWGAQTFVYASPRKLHSVKKRSVLKNPAHTVLTTQHVHTLHLRPTGNGLEEDIAWHRTVAQDSEAWRAYLEVSFLRGGVAVDPGAHLGQLLPLCRREQGLLPLHVVKLFQVLLQHLVSTPKTEKASERHASLPAWTHLSVDL